MKLLHEDKSRSWYLVKEFTTKSGLDARINQCVWNRELMPTLSLHDHYTGYVRIPSGMKMSDSEVEKVFDVHGGVTFTGGMNDRMGGADGWWVGFDMAHIGDENIVNPLEYAEKECENLANQITLYFNDISGRETK